MEKIFDRQTALDIIERIDFIMEECIGKDCSKCWNFGCNDNEHPKRNEKKKKKGKVSQEEAYIPDLR